MAHHQLPELTNGQIRAVMRLIGEQPRISAELESVYETLHGVLAIRDIAAQRLGRIFSAPTHDMVEPEPQPRPTPDERAGMDWWNGMTKPERGHWLNLSGGQSVADAWAYYKRHRALRSEENLAHRGSSARLKRTSPISKS